MSHAAKAKFVFLALLPYFIFYFLLQTIVVFNHTYNLTTEIDDIIPFVPEFIWIYHTIIPVFLLTTIFIIERKSVFFVALSSSVLAYSLLLIFYALLPAFYPRAATEATSLSALLVDLTRTIDGANNTFPSGHVTFAWLLVLFIRISNFAKKCNWIQPLYIIWACLISVSTLVLKQHFIVDVFSGMSLAALCYFLAKRFVFERMLITN
jgi:membrane-associated phospholipid phosphatase